MKQSIMKSFADRKTVALPLLFIFLILLFMANMIWGAVDIPAKDVLAVLSGGDSGRESWNYIILETRLPQAVAALLAGASISVAGLMLQTLFGNPLAGPEVLGISGGAGLGVAIVMLLSHGVFAIGDFGMAGHAAMLSGAFMGAMLIIAVVLFLSSLLVNKIFLLIAGVAISYLTSSVISILNYIATAEGVHSYLIWGMGSFSAVSMEQLPLFAFLLSVLLFCSLLMMKPLDALLLGDAYAGNLGINVRLSRFLLLVITGLLIAVVTAFCGPVSFLGLAVPHLARLSIGSNNHRVLLPATMLLGGCMALLCNSLTMIPGEGGLLPLGAITPIIGAPVIIYVILRDRFLWK